MRGEKYPGNNNISAQISKISKIWTDSGRIRDEATVPSTSTLHPYSPKCIYKAQIGLTFTKKEVKDSEIESDGIILA